MLRRCVFTAALLILPLLANQARAGDLTDLLPAETLAYTGWSQMNKLAGDELSLVRTIVEAVATAASGDNPGEMGVLREVSSTFLQSTEGAGVIALLDITPGAEMPVFDVVAVLDAGPNVVAFPERLGAALKKLEPAPEFKPVQIGGVAAHELKTGSEKDGLFFATHGKLLIISSNKKALESTLQRAAANPNSLAKNPALIAARKKLNARFDAGYGTAFIDVQAVIKKVMPLLAHDGPPPELMNKIHDSIGLSSVRSICMHVEPSDRGVYSRLLISVDGERRGLLKLWNQKPVTDDDLKVAPQDAYWVSVSNLDLSAMWRDIRSLIEEVHPDARPSIEHGVTAVSQFLGAALETEFLPAFGDTWTFLDAPAHGGFLITGAVMIVEATDAERVRQTFEDMFSRGNALASLSGGKIGVQIAESKRDGRQVQYAIVSGLPIPFAPAWTLVGNKLIFGLSPQAVLAAAESVDPKTRKSSILDNPEFKAARALLPKDVVSVGYSDSKRWARLYYPFGTMLATAALSMTGAKPESQQAIAQLPSLAETISHTPVDVAVCTVDADGILYSAVGAGFSPSKLAFSLVAPAALVLPVSILRARESGQRVASFVQLRSLGMACQIYASEHDKLPASLEDVKPYLASETGTEFERMLASPRDPSGHTHYVYLAGHNFATEQPSETILIYEPLIGAEDGACVLFLDGSVRWLEGEPLRNALYASYKNLKRENELPANLRPRQTP